jgi:hypothetical protein
VPAEPVDMAATLVRLLGRDLPAGLAGVPVVG